MIKTIHPTEATLGIYVVKFEGSWFQHPFWRRGFVVDQPGALEKIRASGVSGIVVDYSKSVGLSVEEGRAKSAKPASQPSFLGSIPQPVALASGFIPPSLKKSHEASYALREADQTIKRSKQVITKVFLDARLGKRVNLTAVEGVVDDVYKTVGRHEFALAGLLRCKEDKGEVYRHALAVSALMVGLARKMGLRADEIKEAGLVGLMCDIGVGQLPEALEPFDGDYRALRRDRLDQHVFFGHDLLAMVEGTPASVLTACLEHHERLDGSGYPQGLTGEQIGQLSRMLAICDEFDYLVTGGFQRPPLESVDAVAELQARSAQFDQSIMSEFAETIGIYPIGTFVELTSGRLAMVVGIPRFDTAMPTVRIFYSLKTKSRVRNQTVDLASSFGTEQIVGIAKLDGHDLPPAEYLRAQLLTAAYR